MSGVKSLSGDFSFPQHETPGEILIWGDLAFKLPDISDREIRVSLEHLHFCLANYNLRDKYLHIAIFKLSVHFQSCIPVFLFRLPCHRVFSAVLFPELYPLGGLTISTICLG